MQRFPWSRDILGEASHADEVDHDLLMKLLMGGGKKKAAAKCKEGDLVECDLCVGTVKAVVRDGAAYVLEKQDKTGFLVMPSASCEKFVDYPARCTKLIDMCTSVCFNYVRRGLFERDKLMVSSLFVMTLQIADAKLKSEYMMTLLEGRGESGEPAPEGVASWLPELVWPKVRALQKDQKQVPLFANLMQAIEEDPAAWDAWYNSPQPEQTPPPGGDALSTFEVVMLLGAMRGDRVTMGMQKYISECYGDNYVFQPPFDMRQAYTESTASTPMFFVLFPGVDPTVWIEEIGEKFGFTTAKNNFINISMGQGQEAPAEAMIEKMAPRQRPARRPSTPSRRTRSERRRRGAPLVRGSESSPPRTQRRPRRAAGSCSRTCTSCRAGSRGWSGSSRSAASTRTRTSAAT